MLEDALGAYPGTVLLVTHDRHLIRGVCDALIEVRGGKAIWHEGVDEKVLNPLGTVEADVGASSREAGGPASKKKQKPKKAPQSAAKSASGNVKSSQPSKNDTRQLRKQQQSAERKWEKAEGQVALIQEQLADPAVYEDNDKVQELVANLEVAKDKAAELMAEWETATEALEAAG